MELKIKNENETPLLSRKEVTLDLTYKGATPSAYEIKEAIAALLKSDVELTVIQKVYTTYGTETAKVTAHIYSSKEDMEKIESKSSKKKNEKPKVESEGSEEQ